MATIVFSPSRHFSPISTTVNFICSRSLGSLQQNSTNYHHQFVICGGGTGGLAVASSLARRFGKHKVAIIEPSDVRYID